MRTAFLHGEVDQYAEAKEVLVERFARACADSGDESAELVGPLLDDKVTRDGLLARWAEPDVERFMVEVAPRCLVLDDWSRLPRFLHRWIDFLAGQDLLMTGDPPVVHAAIDRATPAYLAAMAEPAEWGPAKFYSVAMLEQGVDPGDEDAVEEFFAGVESGEVGVDRSLADDIEERDALEPPRAPAYWLPPIVLPDENTLAVEAPRTRLLPMVRALHEWVGEGRDLDAGGLSESDVDDLSAALVEAGGPSEAFAATVLVEWAKHANLLRVVGKRLVRTQISGPLLAEPGLLWTRLWQSFVLLDDVFGADTGALDLLAGGTDSFPELVQEALCALYAHTDAVPLELLVDLTVGSLLDEAGHSPDAASAPGREAVRRMLVRVLDHWEIMGAVRRYATTDDEQLAVIGAAVPDGVEPDRTMIELLPLGVWAARGSLQAFGLQAPSVEEMVPQPAEVLALAIPASPPDAVEELVTAWIAERGPQAASAELTSLLRRVDDPTVRLSALWLLENTGATGVEAALELCDDPIAGPAVRMWLQARPASREVSPRPGDELAFSLDGMVITAVDDAELFLSEFRQQPTPSQLAVIDEIPRTGHSHASVVLDVIARLHPDDRASKAARRSWERLNGTGEAE